MVGTSKNSWYHSAVAHFLADLIIRERCGLGCDENCREINSIKAVKIGKTCINVCRERVRRLSADLDDQNILFVTRR